MLIVYRQSTTPISTVPSQVGVVSPTITSPHHHRTHTSPVYKTTPTTISQPPQKVPPHTQKKSLPRTQSFTISLPRKYTSRGKPTLPTPTPSIVPPTTPSTAPPTALRMISGKKFRPIAPAPLHPVVANTPQHPTAAVRSSIRVITTGNPRSSIQFGIRSLPKLKRAPNLPPLSASIQHVIHIVYMYVTSHYGYLYIHNDIYTYTHSHTGTDQYAKATQISRSISPTLKDILSSYKNHNACITSNSN